MRACGRSAGVAARAAELWEPLGDDRADALKLLSPLIRSPVDSRDEQGLPLAITGPFVRGDVDTVESHLETTNRISPEMGRACRPRTGLLAHGAGAGWAER